MVGKLTSIIVNSCENVNLHCESVVASIEVVRCTALHLHTTGHVPQVVIDKSVSVNVHVDAPPESVVPDVDIQIVTSQASDVLVHTLTSSSAFVVPSRFTSCLVDGRLVTQETLSSSSS